MDRQWDIELARHLQQAIQDRAALQGRRESGYQMEFPDAALGSRVQGSPGLIDQG